MARFGGQIIIVLVLLIGIGIGYFFSKTLSGSVILKNSDQGISENILPNNPDSIGPENKCKDIVCKPSFLICPDKFNSTCNNSCSQGVCSSCQPDCKTHQIIGQSAGSKSNSSSLLQSQQSASSPFSGSSGTSSSTSTSSSQQACSESWSCTDWSACSNSQQNRTCADSSNCGSANTKPPEAQTCTENQQKQLMVSVAANSQTIVRGNEVIISAKVTENQSPIETATVELTMTYASGTQQQSSGSTNSAGEFSWTKLIGGNSKPGTFTVAGKATKTGYLDGSRSTTFEVVNATG